MNKMLHSSCTTKTTNHITRMDNSAVTYNDRMSFEIWSDMAGGSASADSEGSVFKVLEGVVYYVDLTCDQVPLCFSCGGKECLIQLLNLTSAAP